MSPFDVATSTKSVLVSSRSEMNTPKAMKKHSAQTSLKNVSSLGRFGVISHHYDE